jgi:lysophospholipase L1-like esterase
MVRELLLSASATVLALGAVEVTMHVSKLGVHDVLQEWSKYARVLEPDEVGEYLRHPARTSVFLQGVTMTFNSIGMRDQEPRVPKPPGVFRILCLGDSHTAGPGVTDDAVYPARLRAMLAGQPIDVVAAGVGGWNTVAEARFLARHVDGLDPDLVALLYVVNDPEPTEAFDRSKRPSGWSAAVYRALVLHSRLFEWVAHVYQTQIAPPDAATLERVFWLRQKGALAFDPTEPGWLASRAALASMHELLQARGARFVIFLNNEWNGQIERAALARLREFGAETGVPIFDTFSAYTGHTLASYTNDGFRDPHQNATGHALLAAEILRTLEASGLMPVPPGTAPSHVGVPGSGRPTPASAGSSTTP